MAAVELTGEEGNTAAAVETRWLPPPLTHEDNRGFLQMLREKKERLGVGAAKVEVRLEKLTVEADVRVGRRAVPTLLNCAINVAQELATCIHMCTTRKRPIKIINEASGIIRPSRMTLLLGAPGSGKTTFLKALAGKLDPSLKMKGKVMYNGEEVNSSTPQYLHAYIGQYDLHHAEMTVRETIDFSSKMLGTNNEFEILGEAIRRKKGVINKVDQELDSFIKATTFGEGSNLTTNYIIKILGLSECADTLVGDEMRRGISGGQKKRATIGKQFFFYYVYCYSHLLGVHLVNPVYIVKQIFTIPRCQRFISLHSKMPRLITVICTCVSTGHTNSNFLIWQVTSKMDQKQYWLGDANKYQYHSIEKFAESFRTSYLPRLVENNQPTDAGKSKEVKTNTSRRISRWNIFKACFSREVLLLKRNSPLHIFKTIQITVLALVISTLFLRTNMSHNTVLDANKYMGALFMAVVIVNFNGMTEIAMTIKRLPIFYKQREVLALPGWALLSSVFLISIPMSLVETGLWTSLTYYVIGYAPSPIRFIQHFVVLFAMHQMSMGLYRFLAAIGRTQVMANMLGTAALIAIYILGGFVISKDDLQPWLRWGYWTSPFTYAQNAVSLNEFLDKRWATEFHYANANTVGEAILRIRGLLTEWHWYWICVSILFGFSLVFNILSIFALEFMSSPHKQQVNINATKVKVENKSQTIVNGSASNDQVILPFRPLTLVFDHINYFVDMPKLLLMKRGGQLIYSGSLGPLSRNMIKYFEAIPGVPRIKEGQNPAAWMLDISSRTTEYEIGVDYAEIYQSSSIYRENICLVDELGKPEPNTEDLHFPPRYWQDFRAQCKACLWKQNCAYWKNSEHNVVRFINTFAVSIMFGIVFWKIGSTIKDEQDVFNILGIVYGSALFLGFMNCSILQPVVAMERVVLYREKAAGMYSTMAYAIAQVSVELPYMFVQVFIFSAIVYPMVGFEMTASKFFWFALYMVLSFMYYTLYGMMTVALTPNIEIAAGLSFLIFIFWNVFSGFIIGRQMIPVWWRWVYWANPAAWTVYGLMFSQLGDRKELIQVAGQPDQTVKEFLESYLGLQDRYFNLVTCLHFAIIALFAFLFFLSIKHLKFQRR
ncbi:hypothetical protein ABZP36_028768 [Zizania latifolia]